MGDTLFAPAPTSPTTSPPASAAWPATLAASFDRHGSAVFGLAQRVTRRDDVAATLTAEVFAELAEVTDEATLAECVLTDVHRRAIAWVRTTAPQRADGVSLELAGLDAGEREVIAAAYFDGLTYPEIAQRLGLSVVQVAGLMQQGLRRLATITPAVSAS